MAFLTLDRARAASGYRGYPSLAAVELRKAAAASTTARFDVFLSHSRLDAEVILGVKRLLEQRRLSVYVDWLEDPQLDRSRVTPATAEVLRTRMQQSSSLIFATSETSPNSKWMPWELGYFDGIRHGHIGILPLVESAATRFVGQEYLGLYPLIEDIGFSDGDRSLGIFTSADRRTANPVEFLKSREFVVTAR